MPVPRNSPPTIIETAGDVRVGVEALRRQCPHLRRVHEVTGDPPLRRFSSGFEGLARIVTGQQLSTASANAIWQRTVLTVQPFSPAALQALDDTPLRAAGLSRPKIKSLRAVAAALLDGGLDLDRLAAAPDAHVREALTAINGIGPWTADIYLMFCLGRADSWAPGDLALQLAAMPALGLEKRPDARAMEALAEPWRPWRSIAAGLLWAYYAHVKNGPDGTAARKHTTAKNRAKSGC